MAHDAAKKWNAEFRRKHKPFATGLTLLKSEIQKVLKKLNFVRFLPVTTRRERPDDEGRSRGRTDRPPDLISGLR